LTLEQLRGPHSSVTRNARICEALYLARYIEKYGTGTLMMIRESIAHALPEPDFVHRPGEFVIILWRDWLSERFMDSLGLETRLRQAITHIKIHRRVTNADYQQWLGVPRRTATRDLETLVGKGILRMEGKGRGAFYVLAGRPPINAPEMGQLRRPDVSSDNRAMNAPNVPKNSSEPPRPPRQIRKKRGKE
jgi:ATP-dependent DNA helicase RecG